VPDWFDILRSKRHSRLRVESTSIFV